MGGGPSERRDPEREDTARILEEGRELLGMLRERVEHLAQENERLRQDNNRLRAERDELLAAFHRMAHLVEQVRHSRGERAVG